MHLIKLKTNFFRLSEMRGIVDLLDEIEPFLFFYPHLTIIRIYPAYRFKRQETDVVITIR